MFRRLAVLAALCLLPASLARAAPPSVNAAAYALVNAATGETLAAKAPQRELPMASTTKIMTALVVLENAELTDRMTVTPEADAIEGSTGLLEAGETLTVRQLLTALLVPSGNDAAVTLAEGVAGSQAGFVALMNQTAQRLGLTETHYANPHGLDAPGHHSSVSDMTALAEVAMRDPVFRAIVSNRRAQIPGPGGVGVRRYESENELLDIDPEADGIKTGMTDGAGYALVAHARRPALGVELYVALIGAPSSDARALDAKRLLDYGFSQYASADARRLRRRVRARAGRGPPGPRGALSGGAGAARADPDRAGGHRDHRRADPGGRPGGRGAEHRHGHLPPGRARARGARAGGGRVGRRPRPLGPGARGPGGPDPVIVTVTLNAALDRTVRVPNFQLGARHRADASLRQPGGKGVNVARALKRLGQPVIATGLAGGRVGTYIIEELTAEGILNDFVRIADESRTSTAVIDPTNSQQTEINEYGPSVQPAELEVLFDKIRYLSKGADVFVLAGSLPRDVPSDLYERLLRSLRRDGMITARRRVGALPARGAHGRAQRGQPQRPRGRGDRGPRVRRRGRHGGGGRDAHPHGRRGGDHPPRGRVRRPLAHRGQARPDVPRAPAAAHRHRLDGRLRATRSWRGTCRPATGTSRPPTRSPWRWPAAPPTRSASAPASSIRPTSSR